MADHVFISYARSDRAYVDALKDDLRRHGFQPWNDENVEPGERWWRTIVQAIRECSAFLVVMTPHSDESEWVEREILLAQEEKKYIFPLLLRGQRFPILINKQYVDVSDGQLPPDKFYERLERVVPPTPAKPEPKRPAKKKETFEPELILIPAGEFLMGTDPQKDKIFVEAKKKYKDNEFATAAFNSEQPQHRVYLPDYYIAKTPVTNAQYAAFVQAASYKTKAEKKDSGWVWRGSEWKEVQGANWQHPTGPGSDISHKSDHPVVQVSWDDAVAYCEWLAQLSGKAYRLPSEAEWEKAARGPDGRIYPWGNEWDAQCCNTREGGKGDTMPVGTYPTGASPYGCLDMAGNVWEWTRSLWGEHVERLDFRYPYVPTDGRENLEAGDKIQRVLRGGSWFNDQDIARCAIRDLDYPDISHSNFGFRVVSPSQ